MLENFMHVVSLVAAVGGIALASYIRYKKVSYQPMVCPLQSNCEAVTHSEYSRFFGIPVELLGIAYYSIIAAAHLLQQFIPAASSIYVVFGLLCLTTTAFLFSLYLTFIQAFTLREWCTWCLCSAALCTTIFTSALLGTNHNFMMLLIEYHRVILGLHLLGLMLGLGGATMTDLFFFKFLKDFRISESESAIMRTMSQVIWFGLSLLIISGIGLYLPEREYLNHSSKFLLKATAVAVIVVNGAFLNLLISPQLINIAFGTIRQATPRLSRLRRIAFALGGISFVSWYTAFGMGLTRSIALSYPQLLGIYAGLLLCAITGSQIMGYLLSRKAAGLTQVVSGRSATVPAQPSSPRAIG